MESNPIGSNLLLVVLGWLCFMLHVRWSDKRAAACPTPPTPTPPRRMRSPDPQPFAGLIHKPVSEACECARNARPQPPSSPPPALTFTRGRKRHIDPPSQFCPAPNCSSYGWSGRGTIRSNGHPGGTPWRQLASVACCRYVPETLGTLLHGTRVSPQMLVWAVGALAEGLGIRAVAWVFEVDPNTVLPWLVETADHATAFLPYFLHDVRVQQVQLDELFALFSVIKDGTISETEAIARLDRSPHEVWAAMDPESKLWLASDPGERTLAMAQRFVQHVIPVLAPDCAPLWLTDGFREYLTAWVTLSGQWVQPYRRQAPGPTPKLRWWPQPGLLYAQVRKQYRRRRLVGMCPRVVFGTRDAVHAVLAPLGWQINTAFIERLHLDMRQHVAALGRRVNTLCKHDAGLRQQ